jgi:hypothetical protein
LLDAVEEALKAVRIRLGFTFIELFTFFCNTTLDIDNILFDLQESVMVRHDPLYFSLDQGNTAPDPGGHGPVSAAATRLQLRDKRAWGEWITFLLLLRPVLIGLPQIPGTQVMRLSQILWDFW